MCPYMLLRQTTELCRPKIALADFALLASMIAGSAHSFPLECLFRLPASPFSPGHVLHRMTSCFHPYFPTTYCGLSSSFIDSWRVTQEWPKHPGMICHLEPLILSHSKSSLWGNVTDSVSWEEAMGFLKRYFGRGKEYKCIIGLAQIIQGILTAFF